ncbi:MAG: leucine-rich repeat domain-containing protein [Pseudomonadota bacterium]
MADQDDKPDSTRVEIDFPFDDRAIAKVRAHSKIELLFIKVHTTLKKQDAKIFQSFPLTGVLQIWGDVTRAAVRPAMECPGVETLIVFTLKAGGHLNGFADVESIEDFTCMYGLRSNDLQEIARLPSIRKLGAQQSQVDKDALTALMDAPQLTDLDFESSNFDDNHASQIAQSKTITGLEIGFTRISKQGLKSICTMQQLKELDIWSNNIAEDDLDMLQSLENLEYLSVGGHDDQTDFTPDGTFPKLEKLPSLKRVWLDGFRVTRKEWTTSMTAMSGSVSHQLKTETIRLFVSP